MSNLLMHFKAKNHLFMKAERTSFFITWLTQKYMYSIVSTVRVLLEIPYNQHLTRGRLGNKER